MFGCVVVWLFFHSFFLFCFPPEDGFRDLARGEKQAQSEGGAKLLQYVVRLGRLRRCVSFSPFLCFLGWFCWFVRLVSRSVGWFVAAGGG